MQVRCCGILSYYYPMICVVGKLSDSVTCVYPDSNRYSLYLHVWEIQMSLSVW